MGAGDREPRIAVHHVGGRAGSRSFPDMPAFERDLVNVLYEADPSCIEQIRLANAGRDSELLVVGAALGGIRTGRAKLHLNYDPYTSSLLPFDDAYAGHYYFDNDCDYVFGDTFAPVDTLEVPLETLDDLCATRPELPAPDFLSIDTQGSELDILAGAERVLGSDVVAIVCEVEFQPIYREQPLFGDVSRFLAIRGFQFVRFLVGMQVAPHRAPIGLRADGFHLFDDALFLRRIPSIEREGIPSARRRQMLLKLAFISIAYRQLEYAILCLEAAYKYPKEAPLQGAPEPAYIRFLEGLRECIAGHPKSFPRSFAQKQSLRESRARFSADGVRKTPRGLDIVLSRADLAQASEVEQYLHQHGFGALAEGVRNRRLVHTRIKAFLDANPDFDRNNVVSGLTVRVE